MDHVAIMKKSWNLLPKILLGQKTIESRWYQTKRDPWGKIYPGDKVYFKNSGEKISVRATVDKVLEFGDLNPGKIKDILDQWGFEDGIEERERGKYFDLFKDKRYCLLIFLKDPTKISPFSINKKGFGMMSAWLTVPSVDLIRNGN